MLTTIGVLAILLLLAFLLLGVPIAFAMGAAGLLGIQPQEF